MKTFLCRLANGLIIGPVTRNDTLAGFGPGAKYVLTATSPSVGLIDREKLQNLPAVWNMDGQHACMTPGLRIVGFLPIEEEPGVIGFDGEPAKEGVRWRLL